MLLQCRIFRRKKSCHIGYVIGVIDGILWRISQYTEKSFLIYRAEVGEYLCLQILYRQVCGNLYSSFGLDKYFFIAIIVKTKIIVYFCNCYL